METTYEPSLLATLELDNSIYIRCLNRSINNMKTIKDEQMEEIAIAFKKGVEAEKRYVLGLIDERLFELREAIEKYKHPTAKEKRKFNNILYHKCCELEELKKRIEG